MYSFESLRKYTATAGISCCRVLSVFARNICGCNSNVDALGVLHLITQRCHYFLVSFRCETFSKVKLVIMILEKQVNVIIKHELIHCNNNCNTVACITIIILI